MMMDKSLVNKFVPVKNALINIRQFVRRKTNHANTHAEDIDMRKNAFPALIKLVILIMKGRFAVRILNLHA